MSVSHKKPGDMNPQLSGPLLARNTLYNLLGQGLPIAVALVAIPLIVQGLGTERFGILVLAWMVIEYFNFFDLGMRRAVTKFVAEKLGDGKHDDIPTTVWTALSLMLVMGILGAGIMILISPWLVQGALKIPEELQEETLQSFYILAFTIPFVITTGGLRGVLQANQRFDLLNAVNIPMGVYTYASPLVVLPFSKSLFFVVIILAVGRIITCMVHLMFCFNVLPALKEGVVFKRGFVGPLVHFGSWITVSSIVGPITVYIDRFLVGTIISVSAVAYYSAPFAVVAKLWIIPSAIGMVIFPAFAESIVQDRARTEKIYGQGVKFIYVALFPIMLTIVLFAHEGLALWLGQDFSRQSTRLTQWLAAGVFINSLAFTPYSLVQGLGRPDLTAKLHLVEPPIYILALWWMISLYGINGAAVVWAFRALITAVVVFYMARRLLPGISHINRRMTFMVGAAYMMFALALLPSMIAVKFAFLSLVLITFGVSIWLIMLDSNEKVIVRKYFKRVHVFMSGN